MKLTTKGRYAVTAMLDIALHQQQGVVTLCAISHRQGISRSYLEQLSAKLRRAELLVSTRGAQGGYRLNRVATEISIAEIIGAIDEDIDITLCHGKENCHNGLKCLTHQLWLELSRTVSHFLQQMSLADLMMKTKRAVVKTQSSLPAVQLISEGA